MSTSARLWSSVTQSIRKDGLLPPAIVAHPLLPVLAALWFAALFGLGALAARASALVGLVLAVLGGAIGLTIGLVLFVRAGGTLPQRPARAAPMPPAPPVSSRDDALRVRSRDAHPDAPPRRPLVVTEDVLPYPTIMVASAAIPATRDEETELYTLRPFDLSAQSEDLPPFMTAALSAVDEVPAPVVMALPEPEPEAVPEPETVPEPEVAQAPIVPPPLASLAAAAPNEPLEHMPLAGLGLVQLIERLALAIATRQALRAAPVPPAAVPDPIPMPEYMATKIALGHFGRDEHAVDQRYSSLADMPLPRPDLGPILVGNDALDDDEPDPVLPFPVRLANADKPAADDADRALREALATLRQMSAQR